MSDTTDVTSDVSTGRTAAEADGAEAGATRRRRSGTGLAGMLLPELQSLAASLGISGTARMRKGELVTAIQERQAGESRPAAAPAASTTRATRATRSEARAETPEAEWPSATEVTEPPARTPRRATRAAGPPEPRAAREESAAELAAPAAERPSRVRAERTERAERAERAERPERAERAERPERAERAERAERNGAERPERAERAVERAERAERPERGERAERTERPERGERAERQERAERNAPDRGDRGDRGDRNQRGGFVDDEGDDDGTGRRGRRSRFRDRRRGRDREGAEPAGRTGGGEPQVSEDDVLVPVAGILDVLDNYAFVRTTGYLSGSNDVYVAMSQVKRYGLRRGDAVTGAVRQPRDGEQRRDKYNPLVRLDTVNGMDPEEAKRRPEFYKLTPLYPQDRLRLETEPHILTTRVIDLVMPIGKGQRALIVSPPKAGKTMVLQAIANAITRNNPECHLMVVLVDERPEEVTDMQRSVKGEVIASTFDRPPTDHTTVAELSVERAKRLVELGHDVVVLLDSITRLGRAYNNASPASGRILSGGIDSTALYPPKRFLGAARNIENGGSLTIIATALVETGSTGDTVIFEEFKGTGNAELKLDRKIADRRIFPAIDIDPSSTRKEEILLAPDELAIVIKLRKVLHALDSQEALNLLLDRLKKTRTNVEFLMQIAQTTPGE
ncbi:MAG TPA: transcription termination factor Rho [Dactylosporangium sp.]|nr:transcription termination factor Rho [Dactylosporangium sp.]